MAPTIGIGELAQFWRMSTLTLIGWRRKQGGTKDDTFEYHEIDALHRSWLLVPSTGFPTVAELLAYEEEYDEPALLTSREATNITGFSGSHQLSRALLAGAFPAIMRFGDGIRLIPAPSIMELRRQLYAVVDNARACRILGVQSGALARFIRSGELTRADPPVTNPQALFVSRQSVIAYLEQHLARDAKRKLLFTAEQWIEMREAHGFEKLLAVGAVGNKFRIGTRIVEKFITHGLIPCLYTPGGNARIPGHAADKWLRYGRVEPTIIAAALGVSITEAQDTTAATLCPLLVHPPYHASGCPTPQCILAYIDARRFGNFDPLDWLRWTVVEGMPVVVGSSSVAPFPGASAGEFLRALLNGSVRGVALPEGRVAMIKADLQALRDRIAGV